MFNYENPIAEVRKKRYEEQPEYKQQQLDDLRSACGHDFDKWQLRVIKRTRKFPSKGDVFYILQETEFIFMGL